MLLQMNREARATKGSSAPKSPGCSGGGLPSASAPGGGGAAPLKARSARRGGGATRAGKVWGKRRRVCPAREKARAPNMGTGERLAWPPIPQFFSRAPCSSPYVSRRISGVIRMTFESLPSAPVRAKHVTLTTLSLLLAHSSWLRPCPSLVRKLAPVLAPCAKNNLQKSTKVASRHAQRHGSPPCAFPRVL